jgi:hypothetical protein
MGPFGGPGRRMMLRPVEAAESEPIISWRAHARGLHSLEELKAAVLRQRSTWWQGRTFHCPLCDVDFTAATPAAEHVVQQQHPVLRMD